ncbi:MAG: hypothetical protein GMKNLPBB_00417 [Myxococcota bacterium]|nr:hypothetical protein [Myxococcota bacterium]
MSVKRSLWFFAAFMLVVSACASARKDDALSKSNEQSEGAMEQYLGELDFNLKALRDEYNETPENLKSAAPELNSLVRAEIKLASAYSRKKDFFKGQRSYENARASLAMLKKVKLTAGDSDGDGVEDAQDRCIAVAETPNGFQDEDGCPETLKFFVVSAQGSRGEYLDPKITLTPGSWKIYDSATPFAGSLGAATPGKYVLTASAEGYKTQEVELDLTPDSDDMLVDLVLEPVAQE